MNRVSVFEQIHSVIKVILRETALSLEQIGAATPEELRTMAQNIEELVLLNQDYIAKQEQHLHPCLFEYEPSVVDIFKHENKATLANALELVRVLEKVSAATEPTLKREAGYKLDRLFTQFLSHQLELMRKKESILNPILWRYYSREYLQSLQEEFIQQDTCKLAGIQAKWIIKAFDERAVINWLKSVERNASTECMHALLSIAEEQMDEKQFTRVAESLTEGVLLV